MQNVQDKLEKEIDSLIDLIQPLNEKSVFLFIAVELTTYHQSLSIYTKTGLTSPYMQYMYLSNLLLHRECDGTKSLDKKMLNKIKKKLENIVNYYGLMFFEEGESDESTSEPIREITKTVMPYFLNYFNTADLLYEDQKKQRLINLFEPFNEELQTSYSFTVNELIAIYNFIYKYLQNQFHSCLVMAEKMNDEMESFFERVDNGIDIEKSKSMINNEPIQSLMISQSKMYSVPLIELENEFGEKLSSAFIKVFACSRGTGKFRYYTDKGVFNSSPIYINDESIIIPIYRELLNSIEYVLTNKLLSTCKTSFLKNRDKKTEIHTLEIFQRMLGDSASYYTTVFETKDSQFEHDLLIEIDNKLIICEVKASFIKEPFRNPRKAYTRIKRDFKSDGGIQKAYNQAHRLKKLIEESNQPLPLYDSKGNVAVIIDSKKYEEVFEVLITLEDFSVLATNLSHLLEKDSQAEYPWASSLYAFEMLVEGVEYLGESSEFFFEYLRQRRRNHDKLIAADELEIAGVYLRGDLQSLTEKRDSYIQFVPDTSEVFDDIYLKNRGYDIDVVLDKKIILNELNRSQFLNDSSKDIKKKKQNPKAKRKLAKRSRTRNRKRK